MSTGGGSWLSLDKRINRLTLRSGILLISRITVGWTFSLLHSTASVRTFSGWRTIASTPMSTWNTLHHRNDLYTTNKCGLTLSQ